MANPRIHVTELDHIVLRCHDVETTLTWYVDVLGLEPSRVDEWRRQEVFFPSVRINDHTIIDLLAAAPDGTVGDAGHLDHLCLVIEPVDFGDVIASGVFEVVDGPGTRFGARGDATSLYVRDPDGAVVELRYY